MLNDWGFGDKIGAGRGITALLSGPPGTGKTMVAALIAQELRLDLYQVDLSKVVSKYIGETEKQLGAVFDAAESGHAVVLFDEADSLFGKRSEVRSSNDRYANLEVNYLLQRLEAFTGIALLTTNHEAAIDEAFRRRLAVHVRFPVPDETQRGQLWRAMIPGRAAVEGEIDAVALGREFEMTGGYIKNAALRAAYLAADEGVAISQAHLWRAARAEYEALGKVMFHRA
ncbi:MAG TPA: ATP-binding protein [Kofleriaceae bacterium]|nr:ATP-binding protein [Kofleriaceae bacterium]